MDKKKYKYFASLLLYFLEYTVESYEPLSDEDTMKEFVRDNSYDGIKLALQEARAILKEDPFPEELITDIANRGNGYTKESLEQWERGEGPLVENPISEWIEWMIVELEKGLAEKYGDNLA